MTVLAYITDLFFQAKVEETAAQVGVHLSIVTSLYKFLPELSKKPSLVLIDLDAQGIGGSSLISQIKENHSEIPVVAYTTHVQKELIQRARKAGADQVLPRSEFSKQLPDILAKYEVKSGG